MALRCLKCFILKNPFASLHTIAASHSLSVTQSMAGTIDFKDCG